jgi:uncharacterized protein (DUF488 family)
MEVMRLRDSMGCIIYTVGSSTRTWEEFIGLLELLGVGVVIDVRRFPKSKFPHFVKEALDEALSRAGIAYEHLGEAMGGFRAGGYESHMMSRGFQGGLGRIEKWVALKTPVIMCAERLPWRCHRRWIARALMKRGWPVVHVIGPSRVWIDEVQLEMDLFSRPSGAPEGDYGQGK